MTTQCILLPDPYSSDWATWIDAVTGYNPGLHSWIDANGDWREVALQFCLAFPQAPSSDLFDDWVTWAAAVKAVMLV